MEKIKLTILGTIVSATFAFATPASAFSLGAAMNDISKATLILASAAPLATLDSQIGRASGEQLCAPFSCHTETVRNSVRFAVYRAVPDAEIFTGSIPAEQELALSDEQYPAFNIGYGTQTIWPSLLRVDTMVHPELTMSAILPASRHAPDFIDI